MSVKHEVSLIEAAEHIASENHGGEISLPDAVDAVANLARVSSDDAKAAVFWLIDRKQAHLTETFMVAFTSDSDAK